MIANPPLPPPVATGLEAQGFDLEAMAGLGAHSDGSGGGIFQLEWEMRRLRELQERIALLHAFVRKYQLLLARLSWSLDADAMHPTKTENGIRAVAPEIELCSYAYDKRHVEAVEIAALWPDARWSRSMPRWGKSETERDYTAEVDGVVIRIKDAERLPPPRPKDRFAACGPILIPKAQGQN